MSVLVMVLVCNQRNTGGARSSSTRVVGQFSEPSALMSAVMGSATFPAKSVSVTANVTHELASACAMSPGKTTRGPAHQRVPPPDSIPGASVSPVSTTSGVRTGSEVSKQMDTVHGLDATGSLGESVVTFKKIAVGAVTSTCTHAGSVGRGPVTAFTVVVVPPAELYVMLQGTGLMSPHSRYTTAEASHRLALPSAPVAISSPCTTHDTFGGEVEEDTGPMVAASMVTFPDTSSAIHSVSPSLPNQG